MTKLTKFTGWDLDPFDLMWKNLIDQNSNFNTIIDKINYPTDIYETDSGIVFELAVVGLDSKDIDIKVQGDVLRISYARPEDKKDDSKYIYKGIVKRSFDLAWRVAQKFDLSQLEAELEKGLLKISIPFAEESKLKQIQIKSL